MKEPVVGRLVVQTELGRFVGVVRSVESQFVEVLAVGEFVEESAVGGRAAFERWTRFGRRKVSVMLEVELCLSSVR